MLRDWAGLTEKLGDLACNSAPAQIHADDPSLTVDQDGFRYTDDSEGFSHGSLHFQAVRDLRPGDPMGTEPQLQLLRRALIAIDADDREPSGLELLVSLTQVGKFGDARSAPARPKLDEDHLPRKFLPCPRFTIEICCGEDIVGGLQENPQRLTTLAPSLLRS